MRVLAVPCLKDNYAYLIACPDTGVTAVVDPGEAAPVEAALAAAGLELSAVWATHHHADHVGGIAALVAARPGLAVYGHASDRGRIPHLTHPVDDGARVPLGRLAATILHNPGHTLGAVSYVVDDAVFTGDTLFAAGCGRLFEGTAAMMAASLGRLATLPDATRVFFGHEYTAANLRFAAAVEPSSSAIAARAHDLPATTTPSTIALERATNPFLRGAEATVAAAALAREPGLASDDPVAVFAALRRWKDTFR